MNDDNNLDLLDLDDNGSMDTLPDAVPFASPRPKKPWLLLSVGVVVIILATYIIIRAIGDDSSYPQTVDLNAPVDEVVVTETVDMNVMPPAKQEKPVVKPAPVQPTPGVPVRVVEERKDVQFNPAVVEHPAPQPVVVERPKPVAAPVSRPAAQQVAKPAAKPAPVRPAAKTVVAKPVAGSWYVQFGSYSSRALAESAQRQITNAHKSLFDGKQFVILAAQLKDGKTTYRLRVAFKTANDANGFCRNAKSDGLDCYVAK